MLLPESSLLPYEILGGAHAVAEPSQLNRPHFLATVSPTYMGLSFVRVSAYQESNVQHCSWPFSLGPPNSTTVCINRNLARHLNVVMFKGHS